MDSSQPGMQTRRCGAKVAEYSESANCLHETEFIAANVARERLTIGI